MMKRTLAFTACALLSSLAHGQSSVTLYGSIDTGVQFLRNGHGSSQVSITSGAYQPSRFGLSGTEDLGGGYAAIFTLENGFNADDGTTASPTTFFNRFALLGLRTPAGTFTAGRLGSIQFDKTVFYDPLYYANYSQLALNAAPITTLKINNMIKYQSAKFAGWDVDAAYGAGQELAASKQSGRYMGAALEYVMGGLSTRVLYEQLQGSINGAVNQSSLADRRSSVAAAYKTDLWTLFADYTHVAGDLQVSPDGNIYTTAVAWQPASSWRLVGEAGLYHRRLQTGDPKLFNAMAQYFLSRRTSMFVISGYMINAGGNAYSVVYPTNPATTVAGENQLGVVIGMDHRF